MLNDHRFISSKGICEPVRDHHHHRSGMDDQKFLTVYISDMKASRDTQCRLVTHSLGSCIGLVGYDRVARAGALLHFQLPDSAHHQLVASENPFMFADTGIPLFLEMLYSLGAERRHLSFGMFGGAMPDNEPEMFRIGVKNARAAKKIMWQHSCSLRHEMVGGADTMTVSLDIATGGIGLRKNGRLYKINDFQGGAP